MNEFDRKFFINLMERMIKAYDCGNGREESQERICDTSDQIMLWN